MNKPLRRSVRYYQKGDSLSPDRQQIVEVDCAHCGKVTRKADVTIIDAAERFWRDRFERLLGSLNEVVARCHAKHGTDPMRDDFKKWLIEAREQLAKEEGEEWKKGR